MDWSNVLLGLIPLLAVSGIVYARHLQREERRRFHELYRPKQERGQEVTPRLPLKRDGVVSLDAYRRARSMRRQRPHLTQSGGGDAA